jgi:hypothetical protein
MGFLDELKDKAEDVIENVKDRVGGDDDTPAENADQRNAATAAAETGQDVGEFAPVGATEPEVAAVEDATAGAAEQSASTRPAESPIQYTTSTAADTDQGTGTTEEGTASAALSVDEALGSQEAAGDTEGDSEST